jgi:hypothetical protein
VVTSRSLGRKTRIDFMKTNTIRKVELIQMISMLPILTPIVIVLPFYSLRWAAVSGAFLFTMMVCLSPATYCTRGGSLIPAIVLAAFMWFCAVVAFVLAA